MNELLPLIVAMAGPATRGLCWDDLTEAEAQAAQELIGGGFALRRQRYLFPTLRGRQTVEALAQKSREVGTTYVVETFEVVEYRPPSFEEILECCNDRGKGTTLPDISAKLQIPYSTVYNQVAKLVKLGLLETVVYREPKTRGRTPARYRRAS